VGTQRLSGLGLDATAKSDDGLAEPVGKSRHCSFRAPLSLATVLDQGLARFDGSNDGIVHGVHNPAALESVMDGPRLCPRHRRPLADTQFPGALPPASRPTTLRLKRHWPQPRKGCPLTCRGRRGRA
jgi:hypothetical protein